MSAGEDTTGGRPVEARRVESIDVAKGVAIALMVFGHVLGGMLARKWLSPADDWQGLYDFIYLFHMPVFFMISGYLLAEGAVRLPIDSFISRVGTIVWPYVVWDVGIRWALTPLMRQYMISPPDDFSLLELIRKTLMGEMAWFFWTLFFTQAIYIAFARLSALVIFAGSIVIFLGLPFVTGGRPEIGALQKIVDFMPFLALGALLKEIGVSLSRTVGARHVAAAIAIFACLAAVAFLNATSIRPVRLASGFAGIFATMVMVWSFRPGRASSFLASVGTASLVIYLLHPYFHGAARQLLTAVIGSAPYLNLALFTAAALFGPYAIWLLTERLGLSWLFRLRLTPLRRSVEDFPTLRT